MVLHGTQCVWLFKDCSVKVEHVWRCFLLSSSTVAVSFNYLWQWASWILIIPSLVFPWAPHRSLRQHDEITHLLHPILIGFFLSAPDIFWESKVIISWAEDVGRRGDSHASDSRDVIWLSCPEWSSSALCVVSYEEIQVFLLEGQSLKFF